MTRLVTLMLAGTLLAAPLPGRAGACAAEAAPKDEPLDPAALTAKVNALFKGKVVKFDAKTLALELLYEFKNEKEAEDFTLSEWAFAGKKGSLKVADGGCRLLKSNQVALVPGRFATVSAEVDFTLLSEGDQAAPCLTVCSDGAGSFYEIVGLYVKEAYLQRCLGGGFLPLGKSEPSPFAKERRGSMSIRFEKGRLTATVGKSAFEAEDASLAAGQVGLRAYETDVEFRNLRISGVLERAWVDRLMGRAPPAEAPKPPPAPEPKPRPEEEEVF